MIVDGVFGKNEEAEIVASRVLEGMRVSGGKRFEGGDPFLIDFL